MDPMMLDWINAICASFGALIGSAVIFQKYVIKDKRAVVKYHRMTGFYLSDAAVEGGN